MNSCGIPCLGLATISLTLVASTSGAATFVLQWTAPGDDGMNGTAATYDLRYATSPLTEQSFTSALPILSLPAPTPAGTIQRATVAGLPDGQPLWFAMRTRDEAGNWSKFSNLAQVGGVTDVAPGAAAEARFSNPWPSPARERITFRVTLPEAGALRLEILDVAGRLVRRVARDLPAGESNLTWDLRDRSGQRLAPGVYLARAAFSGRQWTRRVVVIQ